MQRILNQKLRRMTLIAGMVGSDGIVLAADRSRVRPASDEKRFDDKMTGRKITNVPEQSIAYAVAGDAITDQIGADLIRAVEAKQLDFAAGDEVAFAIRTAVETAAGEKNLHKDEWLQVDRTLMLVYYGNRQSPQLWRIRVSDEAAADRVDGFAIAGGTGNPARFFSVYFREGRTVQQLIRLASHIVLMGSQWDSLMISGLDVAVIDQDGLRLFSEAQLQTLRSHSMMVHKYTSEALMAPISLSS